jgi:sulfur relay (sulfurtransferase) complex TusBCD TusD component (DsrE family)
MKSKIIIPGIILPAGFAIQVSARQPQASGLSDKLLEVNDMLKEKVTAMKKDGIIVEACIACSNKYGVTDELKVCQVGVKGMGAPLSKYLKKGYKVVSFLVTSN